MSSNDSPPSYDAVLADIEKRLGPNPTLDSFLSLAKELPPSYIEVLASTPVEAPVLDEKQKEKYSLEVAKALSSDEHTEKFEAAAENAAAAVKNLQEMFISLTSQLTSIDAQHQDKPFAPTAQALHKRFTDVVQLSRDTATKIASYGTQFDTVVMSFCADESLTPEERRSFIAGFVKDADAFRDDAKKINTNFGDLHSDFAVFEGTFTTWAKGKEGEILKNLEDATKQLKALREQAADLETAGIIVGSVGTGIALTAGVAAIFMGPVGIFVAVGGLITAGVTFLTVLGLGIAAMVIKEEAYKKQQEIDSLNKQVELIRSARSKLEAAGITALASWQSNISAIDHLWQSVQQDANEIISWLEKGAKLAEKPKYMKMCLEHDVGVYKNMATYLSQYAKSA